MADEDIVLGADTSGALRSVAQLRDAIEGVSDALNLSGRAGNNFSNSMERSLGAAMAASVKLRQATQQTAAAGNANVSSMEKQATAAQKLAAEEKRVYDAMGLARNSNNRVVNSDTGRFASKEQINLANSYVRSLEEINRAEELLTRTQAARAAAASRHNQTQLGNGAMAANTTGPMGSAGWNASQQAKGMADFARSMDAVKANVAPMISLRDVMSSIPPVTWAQKLNEVTASFMGMSNATRYALYSVAGGAAVAGAAILGFGVTSVSAAMSHERAFANVERTTSTTAAGYEVLRNSLEQMATELPVTFDELTKIASAAGQLGISATGISNFTGTVARLTATTNLSADAAGIALSRFKAFFAEADDPTLAVTEQTFSNLASSILKVGVNSIASETGIVNVATQISSMGRYAGFTADQVIGLSGALASVGVAPELSRGITTRLFTIIGDEVSKSGVQLEKFASLSNVSADTFKSAWGTEAFAPIFTNMLEGLHRVSQNGGDANGVLRDLGVTAVRDRPVWLRLAGAAGELGVAGTLVAQTMRDARAGWVENSELALQYTKISTTTSARLQVMANAFEQLFASMGSQSNGMLGELAVVITNVVKALDGFAQSEAGAVLGTMVTQGALVMGALLLVVGALAGVAATAQGVGQAFDGMTAKGEGGAKRLTAAFRLVGMASGLIGIIASIASMVGVMIAMGSAAEKATVPVQDMNGMLSAMKSDAEAASGGIKFFAEKNTEAANEQKASARQAESMTTALRGVAPEADAAASSLDGVAASAERAAYIYGKAASEFYNQQLLQDSQFQDLFKLDAGWNKGGMMGVELLDWDALKRESLKESGDVALLARQQIEDALGKPINSETMNLAEANAYLELSRRVGETLGGVRKGVQEAINAEAALAQQTKRTVAEVVEDFELLDDVTQKTVNSMAEGFQKFADPSNLIGLTQKFEEIMSAQDVEGGEKAAQWQAAWDDAYGGVAFSMENYLMNFRRAADEQAGFIANLNTLGVRDMSQDILNDLAMMGPEANKLVAALVDSTDEQLAEFETLWGQTGYDSMVKLATQAAIGQEIIRNVMESGGIEALRAFNNALSSGMGVNEALASIQLDLDGKPLTTQLGVKFDEYAERNRLQSMMDRLGLTTQVNAIVNFPGTSTPMAMSQYVNMGARKKFATGGYTGSGGKYEYAGDVHRGEFVMTKEATRAIGVGNLYAMMRQAQAGRAAPRGKGYAQGGYVGSGSGAMPYMEFSPTDRALLRRIAEKETTISAQGIAGVVNTLAVVSNNRGAN